MVAWTLFMSTPGGNRFRVTCSNLHDEDTSNNVTDIGFSSAGDSRRVPEPSSSLRRTSVSCHGLHPCAGPPSSFLTGKSARSVVACVKSRDKDRGQQRISSP